jgi:hypothetical protein
MEMIVGSSGWSDVGKDAPLSSISQKLLVFGTGRSVEKAIGIKRMSR